MGISMRSNLASTWDGFVPAFTREIDTSTSLERFNALVKYLMHLQRDGTISDEDFSGLVHMASASFVESEITDRVDQVLEDAFSYDMLLKHWK